MLAKPLKTRKGVNNIFSTLTQPPEIGNTLPGIILQFQLCSTSIQHFKLQLYEK